MRDRFLAIVRVIICLLGLPWLALLAVFLILYSPFYLLFSLISLLKNAKKKSDTEFKNQTSKPGLTKLEVKHA